jgi:NADH:ubiquinone oxidoreductase subunit E
MIADNKLEEKVELKASFCLGRCTEGVSIKIGDDFIPNVTVSNAEHKFMEHVMERLK